MQKIIKRFITSNQSEKIIKNSIKRTSKDYSNYFTLFDGTNLINRSFYASRKIEIYPGNININLNRFTT